MTLGLDVVRGWKLACAAGIFALAAGTAGPVALAQDLTPDTSEDSPELPPEDADQTPIPLPDEHPEEDEDGIVRLPGRGEINPFARRPGGTGPGGPEARPGKTRLVPGGGLLMSFDLDGDGAISDAELETGIRGQFLAADTNRDNYLMPLEQIAWAEGLPTRDDSLANPARFDPNLDRMVTLEEFDRVIRQLAKAYAAESEDGRLVVASLVADEAEEKGAPSSQARRDGREKREGTRLTQTSPVYRGHPYGYGFDWAPVNACAYQRENTPYMTGRLNPDGSPQYRFAGDDRGPVYTPDVLGALCR